MSYKATIGLEIHAELKTSTKMFCSSQNNADETRANVHVCPICLAHPGTLPVINREAVRQVLRVGVALKGTLADYTEFDRKNYFYPDLPKGYQLSQYEFPLVSGGSLNGVDITRVHLEEDTASSIHDEMTGETLIDYNRAGVPLMELVTEPVIHSAKEAGDFGRELQLLLRYLGASDADMEKGRMRLEANISVSNSDELGTKVEIKNINSFRAMERAVEHEIARQTDILDMGQKIAQETRGWDDSKQATFSQRVKEGSADYRYFPDPDLPSLKLSQIEEFSEDALKKTLPELPSERRQRYIHAGIKAADAEQFAAYPRLADFMDKVIVGNIKDEAFIQRATNYIVNDLVSIIRDINKRDTDLRGEIPISSMNFTKIMRMLGDRRISSRGAKDLLSLVIKEGRDPETVASERGLLIDAAGLDVESAVHNVLTRNKEVVADYLSGKQNALQYLIGQCMKELKGAVEPTELRVILMQTISSRSAT
ncbi:MAG: aspartyl-tRNA(Asn)/glutamyl-tRNA (Gln) amidotransferase subunit B [Parcubacteria group bacterium Gr01-1014_8]|nr:MAG: aspartyl-tRNA(Asn)/glutamyl-tRNA (Gln) amidotransferase subunit B [Parcubacteria group bacterium Gr01-1014_8]